MASLSTTLRSSGLGRASLWNTIRASSTRVASRRTFISHAAVSSSGLSASRNVVAKMARVPSPFIQSKRTMFIQTESTPNQDSLKFIPGVDVMGPDGPSSAEFLDTKTALASPLALRLMGIQGVTSVFYGPDFVTVSKDSETPWSVIKPEVFETLMEHFSIEDEQHRPPLFRSDDDRDNAGPQDTRILDTDSETVAMIKELLDTRVRPSIMEDGGDIEYRGFTDDGIVQLKLKGSCRGCDSSSVTLKSGIERMLMHYIPEVTGVEQVLGEEEAIALDEFSKFEKRLEKQQEKASTGLEQYASV